jgi:hypothetical protein
MICDKAGNRTIKYFDRWTKTIMWGLLIVHKTQDERDVINILKVTYYFLYGMLILQVGSCVC